MISLQRRCKKHRQSQVFSIRAGLTFEKINPEVLFYGTSGRDFMLFGVLPDSNSFYYHHTHIGSRIEKTPLIVPDYQMESLKIACASEENDIIIVSGEIQKFEKGQLVRVVKGEFEGFMGIVARHKGQQRVGIVVDNLLTVLTAYVPSAYCEKIDNL